MRPLSKDEAEEELIVEKISPNSVSILDHCFTYDAVAGVDSTQEDIFRLIGIPLVENCLAGFNSSIFAYGQTGSGKTYTMWGPLSALHGDSKSKDRGLTPCVFERLFARIEEEQAKHSNKQLHCQCRCSFLEIYNEQITDLLDPTQRNLQIREDTKTGVYVDCLTEEFVSTMKEVTELLMKGLANRRTGATSINIESSRSHCVFTCVVEFRSKSMADGSTSLRTSRINLVDLAGSERQKQTGAGGERLKEAGNINRSLSQLGNLINILAEVSQSGKQRHIPYRDSKLTFLLQESLGGNAKMAMICAVSPSQRCKSETFSTLRFAQRAKAIKNKAVVNEVTQDDVNVLREQIRQLKDEILRMKSNGTSTNGSYSTSWNARRSLNLLKMSLNLPTILPVLKDDSDEEMEIDENDVEMPSHEGTALSCFSRDKVPDVLRISKDRLRSSGCRNVAVIGSQAPASPTANGSGNNLVLASEDRGVKEIVPDHGNTKPDGQTFCLPEANVQIQLVNNGEDKSNSNLDCIKLSETNSQAEKEQIILADQSHDCISSPNLTVSQTLSIMPCQTLQESPASVSPLFETCSRKSLRASSSMSATDKKLVENFCSFGEASCISKDSSCRASKNALLPTEQIEASLHHGLQVIDSMQYSSALRRSSFKFPVRLPDAKSILKVDKVDVGAQTLLQESGDVEKKNVYVCCYCKSETLQDEMKDETDGNNMQLVPVEGPVTSEPEKLKIQVPKAVEKVLAGSIRREMALEEHCAKQASEIRQLNRLVEQFKHERECNALIAQTREEKISRLEKLMDGSLPKEEYMDEEFISLANEYKLLKEKYNKHPEVLQAKIELKRMQKELDAYQNFFDLGEREILMEEIQYLRSQFQCYIDSSSKLTRESSLLLQLTNTSRSTLGPLIPILESIEETADEKVEDRRKSWTEKESKWISLTEELTLELEASRTVAEKLKVELDIEKKCTEELKEALQTAMQGHARILEQYADLQEMHVSMLARERHISEGIEDVKRVAAKAGVKGAESKFIHSLATEISVLRAEREKERRYWKDENKGLQAQLRDTAEAVQAAGELLVRLKEAEEAVVTAEKRALLAEQKTEKAYQELDNLKKNYKHETVPLKQYNDESHLSSEILHTESNHSEAAKYNDEESINDQRWKEEFEDFSGRCDTESSKDIDPKSWFFGYDRCNI